MTLNKLSFGLTALLCISFPALAEIDLSGSWAAINHEDSLERGGASLSVIGIQSARALTSGPRRV